MAHWTVRTALRAYPRDWQERFGLDAELTADELTAAGESTASIAASYIRGAWRIRCNPAAVVGADRRPVRRLYFYALAFAAAASSSAACAVSAGGLGLPGKLGLMIAAVATIGVVGPCADAAGGVAGILSGDAVPASLGLGLVALVAIGAAGWSAVTWATTASKGPLGLLAASMAALMMVAVLLGEGTVRSVAQRHFARFAAGQRLMVASMALASASLAIASWSVASGPVASGSVASGSAPSGTLATTSRAASLVCWSLLVVATTSVPWRNRRQRPAPRAFVVIRDKVFLPTHAVILATLGVAGYFAVLWMLAPVSR